MINNETNILLLNKILVTVHLSKNISNLRLLWLGTLQINIKNISEVKHVKRQITQLQSDKMQSWQIEKIYWPQKKTDTTIFNRKSKHRDKKWRQQDNYQHKQNF